MAKHAPQRIQSTNRAHPHFIRPTAVALAVAACFNGPVLANPTAPTVVSGTANFATAGNILNITNSHNAIINWGSFSIGINELTKFIQPSALSAVLNRVTGQDPSAILGALQSNGRVFLLNPNGIVFGAGAQINVAGLVASTLKISDDDFLNNRMKFTDGAGAGSVVNNGSITGGSVYLVGNAVTNNGLITSPNGEVVLAAGNSVELVNPGTPNLRVEIVAPDNEARNLGTITAEAGRIGIYAGLIKQSGTLSADSAVAEGGRIMLKSTKSTMLEAGSVTSARGTSGGQIIALSSMTDGVTEVAGKLDASATNGNGGFIETSAAKVQVADTAVITTQGSNGGQSGTWLIDPYDIIIGTDISASTLVTALGSGNVVIATDAYGGANFYGGPIGVSGLGNIVVDQAVSWSTNNSLTLTANNNITVNQPLTVTGGATGGINLNAGWNGVSDPTILPTISNNSAQILLNAPISTAGTISLLAGGNISQTSTAVISADKLSAVSNSGSVLLDAAPNMVNTLAGNAGTYGFFGSGGEFRFKNNQSLTIGDVITPSATVSGITAEGAEGGTAVVDINVVSGNLTVSSPIAANGYDGVGAGNALVNLTASGAITVDSSVTAQGGNGGSYSAPGGNATVTLSGNSITVNAGVTAQGGRGSSNSSNFGSGYAGGKGGDATMTLTTSGAGGTTINGGTLTVQGGHGGDGARSSYNGAGGNGGDGGNATLLVTANGGGRIRVENAGGIYVSGGNGGDGGGGASGSIEGNINGGNGGVGGNGGIANATFVTNGGGNIEIITGASIAVGGGGGGSGGNGGNRDSGGSGNGGTGGNGGNGGAANFKLTANGSNIEVSGSSIEVFGGSGSSGGNGGSGFSVGGNGGNGGHGADALLDMRATGVGAINIAYGGNIAVYGGSGSSGGYSSLLGMRGDGGRGGNASLLLSAGSGGLTVDAGAFLEVSGGSGGYYSNVGGRGGDATVTLASAGNMNVAGQVMAYGGSGGTESVAGGRGGDVVITLTSAGNMSVAGQVRASGGRGGSGYSGTGNIGIGGDGGNAAITLTSAGNMNIAGQAKAYGGDGSGGSANVGGRGGDASVMVTGGGGIMVNNNSSVAAYGGSGYSGGGQGGAATVVFNATGGNIQIDGSEGYAGGGYGAIGGQAIVALQSVGNIAISNTNNSRQNLTAYPGYGSSTGTYGSAAVIIGAAGNITLYDAADIYSNGLVGIAGANVSLDNASSVSASGSLVVGALGNLDVLNASSLVGNSNAVIGATGNVTVNDGSYIRGNPDVVMSVGGVINMNNGGTIQAVVPSTIYLTFPMLTSGGYFVNGIEGVVYDALTSTGFVAGNLFDPAILGTNLLVTYGGGTTLNIPTDALIVAMGESTKPPDPEKDKNVFKEVEDEKKKDAPVCR